MNKYTSKLAIFFVLIGVSTAYAYQKQNDDLPQANTINIDKSISSKQADIMMLAARKYSAFWNTGEEKYLYQALAPNFIDLNLPQGRKQGRQGPIEASKWFRGVVPDLKAKIIEMTVVKNKVILQLEFSGHFKGKFHNDIGQGQEIKFSAVDVYTIKDGKIATNWHLEDNQTLINQLTKHIPAKGFQLKSSVLKEGESIAANQYWNQFGCSGANDRPDLSWSGAPKNSKSFAVSFYDKDAPTGSGFWHWIVYDIPKGTTNISAKKLPTGALAANTDIGNKDYLGPCPPKGRKHTYVFTLHALDVENLNPPKNATSALIRFFINKHTIGKTTLSVTAGPRE
jgi:Raf kinase inhibitor-like YbhB/YbcL family protein